MKTIFLSFLLAVLCVSATRLQAVTPPVIRSTFYNGAYSNIVRYPAQAWMSSNNVVLTVEAWVYCNDLDGSQTFIARHFSTNLWFGTTGDRLRFYRSGGLSADSDRALVPYRWTHVAVTYDGSTARFFMNGTNAGVKALSHAGNNCTNSLSLGGQADVLNLGDVFAGGYPFNGYLDEVRLWSVARSASAIASGATNEIRSGTGLLAVFGSGGRFNDFRFESGTSQGIPVSEREDGFGILPRDLCIPWTRNGLAANGVVDLLNEYRGAETIVLRSTNLLSPTPDQVAYLMVSTNSTNHHLFVAVPDLPQIGGVDAPQVQVMCDITPAGNNAATVGDWELRYTQDSFQGGTRYGTNPPFITTPQWLSWGQSVSNWQGATLESFEFHQSYEFRIHARHLNYFTNPVGLVVQYRDFSGSGALWSAPIAGRTNQPITYAQANWCGRADASLSQVTVSGVVSNVTTGAGDAGWTVSLRTGANPLSSTVVRTVMVSGGGSFSITENVPDDAPYHVQLQPRTGYNYLPPEFTGSGRPPSGVSSGNTVVSFAPCATTACTAQSVRFRVQPPPGPVAVTGMDPTSGSPEITLRSTPLKVLPATIVTLTGTNLHTSLEVYLSKCSITPPSFCTEGSDIFRCTILSNSFDRTTLTVQLPADDPQFSGSMRWVLKDLDTSHPGWTQWVYGPSGFMVGANHPYPVLHGFEFINRDDGPSIEEFEACYGDSIFNFLRIREPYYGIWAAVYFAWMDGTKGSCYGMAGTSRLFASGHLPIGTFDVADGDGVRGVRYANGYYGTTTCEIGGELCPRKPGRWTGFDLFQPFRPKNVWARITSLAGAQTSAEALNFWLGQLHRPVAFGPRRGFAASEPLAVLNRVRANPAGYTLCVQKRDFGDGHCITPYAVIDGMGLDTNAVTPIVAPNFSLIKVYDNNWPGQERFVEVDRVNDVYRYHSGGSRVGVYEGPGLFSVPISVYRDARHAPDPFFLGRYGLEFLRLLTTGAAESSFADASGGVAGWTPTTFTNGYEGALPYIPFGALVDGTNDFSTTMLFLPASNAPAGGSFVSGGSNVLVYGGMGWGDIAFGFNAPNTTENNSVDGILIGLSQGLQAMGFKAGAPVNGFGAMVASRTPEGASRVFVIDAGSGELSPDLALERDEMKSLTIRNRGEQPFGFRLNLAGTDLALGSFEYAYEFYNQPGKSTLTLRIPENGADRSITRELDLDNDGKPDVVDSIPANGQLRGNHEPSGLALRWRQIARNEVLECSSNLAAAVWSPVKAEIKDENGDRVARVGVDGGAQFYRVKAVASNCLDLSVFPLGSRPNPWETNGFKFEAFSGKGDMLPQNSIVSRAGFVGLDVAHTMRIHPMDDCHVIHIDVVQSSGLVNFEAVGSLGVVVDRATLTEPTGAPQRVSLRGFRGPIYYVRVISPNGLCSIVNVCCERSEQPPPGVRPRQCIDFSNVQPGQYPSPYQANGAVITAKSGAVIIGPEAELTGNWLRLAGEIDVKLDETFGGCGRISLWLRDEEGAVKADAYDADGNGIATVEVTDPGGEPQELVLEAEGIARIVITSNSQKAVLQRICCEP